MTNKQIIIDGINVSELTGEQLVCMNRYEVARLFAKLVDVLSKTEDNYNNAQEDRVRMWTNNTGLTDKLKRKEQECEKLNKQVEIFTRQLEKANKEVIKEKEKNATQRQKNEKLEQTLAEIKDIAKNMNNECFYDDFECKDCDMKNGCTYFNKKQILQKICEVEN